MLHALLIAVAAGLIFALALAVFPRAVLGFVGGQQAAEAAARYAALLFGLGAIPAWLANTLASVLRGGGRHGLAARVLTLAWLVYPGLAWALMEPGGMGLPGAGLAFALVMIAAAAAMAVVVWRGGAGFTPSLRAKPSGALFRRILAVGLVASALASVANLTTILVTARVASYGTAAVAAYGISARIEFLLIPLVFGVGSALTALVGRAVGEGDWPMARRIAWTGAFLSLGLAAALGLPAGLAPGATARAFTDDPAVAEIAARALAYVGPGLVGFGIGMALYFASMGAGRMRGPVLGALSRIAIAVGGGWLLAHDAGMGLDGYFLAVGLGITAFGLIIAVSVRPGVWPGRGS